MGPATPLAELTTLHLGGPSRALIEVTDEDELVEVVTRLDHEAEPVLIVGGGSNLVVADAGFDGTVVRIAARGIDLRVEGGQVDVLARAGEPWDDLVSATVADGLSGLEALSGIPGLTGATPIQNVGAYGQEVADTIAWLRALDRRTGDVQVMGPDECGFTYRSSTFRQTSRYVILAVAFRLERTVDSSPIRYAELARALGIEAGDHAPSPAVRDAVLALRRTKGMVLDPTDPDTVSVGSFFTNPIVPADQAARLPEAAPRYPQPDGAMKVSAAWLIEQAGFPRGYGAGHARISTKHTLALTNRDGGSTDELLELARTIRGGVLTRFGIELTAEPILVGCSL